MDITRIPLFDAVTKRLGWLTDRQAVLAQNIANANTPGYKPRDLRPVDFGAMAEQSAGGGTGMSGTLKMAATNAHHMAPAGGGSDARAVDDRKPVEVSIDGNKINIEDQAMKIADTAASFQLATSLYKKHIQMIRTALGSGGGGGG